MLYADDSASLLRLRAIANTKAEEGQLAIRNGELLPDG